MEFNPEKSYSSPDLPMNSNMLELEQVINTEEVQVLMDCFYSFSKLPMAMVDLKGKILVGIGWQDICTQFHRVHPESCKNCVESDVQLSTGVAPGDFKIYKCKNNMWDIVTPIMVKDIHVGNIFMGQLFFEGEVVDKELFRAQAHKYGFHEEEYMAALERVPRFPEEKVHNVMNYYAELAHYISTLGLKNIMLSQALKKRKQLEEELRNNRNLLQGVVESIQDGITVLTHDLIIRHVNSAVKRRHKKKEPLEGKKCFQVYHNREEPCDSCPTLRCLKSGKIEREEIRTKSAGKDKCFEVFSYPLMEPEMNTIAGAVTFFRDITQRKLSEEKIRYISFHDGLTGLYNRVYMEQEMQRLDTKRQLPISVIMADVNGLKLINDIYGHSAGDEMLKKMAAILRDNCRREDIVSRWGGDEFVALLPQTTIKEAQAICNRIIEECREAAVNEMPLSMALGTAEKKDIKKDLSEALNEAEDNMYKHKLAEGRNNKCAVFNALRITLEEKSFETEEHAQRMQETAMKIGKKINLPETELDRLTILVALHDIGMAIVPNKVLMKRKKLTKNDWEHIKRHPEAGYQIARSMEEYAYAAEDILCHHEHWDGSGYPKGLKGTEIPLLARIISIVDAFEVMIQGRPYREPRTHGEAAAELKRCAGSQFDPELVEVFLSILEE